MAYNLNHDGRGHAYVTRPPTQTERDRYIRNGYNPPAMERESDRAIYLYLRGDLAPNYPVPVSLNEANIAIAWASMSHCQCACCLEHYMDSLEVDFPSAF